VPTFGYGGQRCGLSLKESRQHLQFPVEAEVCLECGEPYHSIEVRAISRVFGRTSPGMVITPASVGEVHHCSRSPIYVFTIPILAFTMGDPGVRATHDRSGVAVQASARQRVLTERCRGPLHDRSMA